jgi:CrcB protein
MIYLGVALAGAIGAPARFLVDELVLWRVPRATSFPLGTLLINISGALLLGFLTGLVLYRGFPDTPRILLGTGFCGAYTTFSTFTFETARLAEDRDAGQSVLNVAVSVAGGTLAAAVGLALAAI